MYPSVYSYIETYEGLGDTLDCAIAELQRAEPGRYLANAIDKLASARAILSHYEGQIDPRLSEE